MNRWIILTPITNVPNNKAKLVYYSFIFCPLLLVIITVLVNKFIPPCLPNDLLTKLTTLWHSWQPLSVFPAGALVLSNKHCPPLMSFTHLQGRQATVVWCSPPTRLVSEGVQHTWCKCWIYFFLFLPRAVNLDFRNKHSTKGGFSFWIKTSGVIGK